MISHWNTDQFRIALEAEREKVILLEAEKAEMAHEIIGLIRKVEDLEGKGKRAEWRMIVSQPFPALVDMFLERYQRKARKSDMVRARDVVEVIKKLEEMFSKLLVEQQKLIDSYHNKQQEQPSGELPETKRIES